MNGYQRNLCSLSVRPCKSYLTRKLDSFSQNDAYIKFELGEQKYKTTTKQNQRKPSWDQQFTINPEKDNILTIIVMDEDQVTDDQIGRGTIDLTPFMQAAQHDKQWVSIKFGRKPAGKVMLEMTPCVATGNYKPNNNNIEQKKKIPAFIGAEDMTEQIYKQNTQSLRSNQQPIYQNNQSLYQPRQQSVINSSPYQQRPYNTQSHFITTQQPQPQFQSHYVGQPQFQSHYVGQPVNGGVQKYPTFQVSQMNRSTNRQVNWNVR